jgi:hypothetical protein
MAVPLPVRGGLRGNIPGGNDAAPGSVVRGPAPSPAESSKKLFKEKRLMKKFLFMFLLVAAVASAFTFALAQDNTDGEKKFVIHGEIRQRADYLDNFSDFDSNTGDSGLFFPYRARLAAEGHFSKNVVGYAEFQMFGVWGDTVPNRGGSPFGIIDGASNGNLSPVLNPVDQNFGNDFFPGSNSVGLYQAWIGLNNLGGTKFSLRIGRQEIVKGDEMLLGDSDFYSGLSHDGIVGSWNHDAWDLDVWMTRPLQSINLNVQPYDHQSINFYGGWLDLKKIPRQIGVSAYVLYFEDGINTVTPERRAFYTVGARAHREAEMGKSGFAWNAEAAVQKGDFNPNGATDISETGDINALGYETMFGYQLHTGRADHMFQVKYDVASGNKENQAPDKAEAFDPLFQDNHMRYGLSDIFSFTDLTAASVGWNMTMKDHTFGADYWMYKLTESITDANGQSEDGIGSELDGWWKYQYNPNTQVMAGFAYFMPGDVVKFSTVPNAPTDAGVRLVGNLRLRF